MRLLVIGGTRFIGRHVVDAALQRGHHVTLLHRGLTGSDAFDGEPRVSRLFGDRNRDLSSLAEGRWDATIDMCAYVPRHVHTLADVLGDRGGHYLLVSSVSAYAPPSQPGYSEDAPLVELDDPTVEEVTDETYGGLKVLCERVATERFGPRSLVVRPTFVVGPDDYTWRFPWWVARIARGGRVLAPGPAQTPAQVIDVRDLAGWMVGLLEGGHTGAYHAVSPPPPWTWGQQLEAIRDAVAPAGTELVWVPAVALLAEGVDGAALPLWVGGEPESGFLLAADPSRAHATGLSPRPLADTIRDTLDWVRRTPMPEGHGLSAEREQGLLERYASRSPSA